MIKQSLLGALFVSFYICAMEVNENAINVSNEKEMSHEELNEHVRLMGKLWFYQKNELRQMRQLNRKRNHEKNKSKAKQQNVKITEWTND